MIEKVMKKAIGSACFAACVVLSQAAFGQCVPDTTINSEYSPTVQEGLPDAKVGVSYEAVIHIRVPKDTSYLSLSATIDSLVLNSVTGLPDGLSYDCTPASCVFPGGSFGCIRIFGIATDTADTGVHKPDASFTFFARSNGNAISFPYNIDDYKLRVKLDSVSGFAAAGGAGQKWRAVVLGSGPHAVLHFDLPEDGPYEWSVFNLTGSQIMHAHAVGSRFGNSIRIGDVFSAGGIYFIQLSQDGQSRLIKAVIP
ncbi:MAG: hypothetical protein Kow0075_13900 [Salibacteraceae bacterium]